MNTYVDKTGRHVLMNDKQAKYNPDYKLLDEGQGQKETKVVEIKPVTDEKKQAKPKGRPAKVAEVSPSKVEAETESDEAETEETKTLTSNEI